MDPNRGGFRGGGGGGGGGLDAPPSLSENRLPADSKSPPTKSPKRSTQSLRRQFDMTARTKKLRACSASVRYV